MARLMLGSEKSPVLLVSVKDSYNPLHFDFFVINGSWNGYFDNGVITVKAPNGDFISDKNMSIICDNQDRLRGTSYQEVFDNFSNENYVAPLEVLKVVLDEDEIPF